ncbi:MAG: phenylalanine--tRNA ligase subunit beta [Gammaproteobacteria bacterium]|nr:phenylalanine--tRNA ligase subunit beta [Gammaproteobacteria bacterium]
MKFSEKWLREWVDPPVSTDVLVEQLTMAGLEVDSVEPAGAGLEGLLVGEVVSVDKHPDADKLKVCSVLAGQDRHLQIVCGAPNVSVGGKYPLAPVGVRLPGDIKIKKSKLRGVESQGMLCSAQELGLSEDHDGLMVLPADARAGQQLQDLLGLDDNIIELDLTPNRGDCLGIEGIAREVGTLLRTAVTALDTAPVPVVIDDQFKVEIQAREACPQYLGRVIRGVDAGARTPLWMQERLRRSGMRSLGPVVDVTNYVLLELGQPMHAFDLARLTGGIRVRYADKDEQLTLLDERTIILDTDTLVIADHDKPLAIAGVMGGIDSGVQESTSDLFLECAFFPPAMIAGRARTYGMHTESAHRFERGVDPGLQRRALERATELLTGITGGEAGPVTAIASSEHLPASTPVVLRKVRIQRVLGILPDDNDVTDILQRLGMAVTKQDDGWLVEPPGFRFDIGIEADLIEEIGRIYGYNRLPSVSLLGAMEVQPVKETDIQLLDFCNVLVARGYQEAVTYSFVDAELQVQINPGMVPVRLANPISSELAEMRTTLWPGLLQAVQHNANRQKSRLRFFEHGLRFYAQDGGTINQDVMLAGVVTGSRLPEYWDGKSEPVDFYDLKNDIETLLQLTGEPGKYIFTSSEHPALHPGQSATIQYEGRTVGWLGRIHPQLARTRDLAAETCLFELEYAAVKTAQLARFQSISRYPSIRRDLAVVVDAGLQTEALQAAVREVAGDLLQEMVVFDVYQGRGIESGRKSIAFGLILQDNSRTLAEQDIEAVVANVTGRLAKKFGATLRD